MAEMKDEKPKIMTVFNLQGLLSAVGTDSAIIIEYDSGVFTLLKNVAVKEVKYHINGVIKHYIVLASAASAEAGTEDELVADEL